MQSIRDEDGPSESTATVAPKDRMEEEDTSFLAEHFNDPMPEPESFAPITNNTNVTPAPVTPSSGGLTEEQRKLIEAKRQEVSAII